MPRLYGGQYHDLLHDLGIMDVAEDVLQWLDSHSDPSGGTGKL